MQDLFRHLRIHTRKKKMKDENICYIHKIAMKKHVEEEPIPFLGIKKFVTYKCPMCNIPLEIENASDN